MKLMKIMYYVNIVIMLVETVTIYMYSESLQWLCIMVLALIVQVIAVSEAIKNKK